MSEYFEINTDVVKPDIVKPYQLIPDNDPILHKRTTEVDLNDTQRIKEVCSRLIATAKQYNAFGVAANQCGLSDSIFVMGAENEYLSVVNPKITGFSDKKIMLEEACLSFPYLGISIERSESIDVEFYNEKGEKNILTFSGMSARIFQHEFNHLEGITFLQKAKPLALKMAFKKREKRLKNLARSIVRNANLSKTEKK